MRLSTRTKELTLLGFGLVTCLLQRLELSCDGLLCGLEPSLHLLCGLELSLEPSLHPLQLLSELRFACTDFSLACAYVILSAAQTCDLCVKLWHNAIESLDHCFCFLHVNLG